MMSVATMNMVCVRMIFLERFHFVVVAVVVVQFSIFCSRIHF